MLMRRKEMRSQIQDVMDDRNQGYKDAAHPTVFKSLLDSDLPPQEKTIDRLQDEGVTLVGAGQETVKATLTIATYHILQNPTVTKTLKEELLAAIPDPANPPELSKLEQLPYLSACIQEGILYLSYPRLTPIYPKHRPKAKLTPPLSPPPLLRPHVAPRPSRVDAPVLRPLHDPRTHAHLAKPLLRAPRRGAVPRLAFLRPRALARQSGSASAAHAGERGGGKGRCGREVAVQVSGGVHEGLKDVCGHAFGACAAVYRAGECVSPL
jgi:hypothetical protein